MNGWNQRESFWKHGVVIFFCALALNLGVALALGGGRPMESDSFYFLRIAASLAQGRGYVLQEGFWPATPTMSRAPGWPGVVSLGLRAFPAACPDTVMRALACGLNAAAAGLVAGLAHRLFRRRLIAWGSGLAYALYPVALYEAYRGTSEMLFIVLALAGTLWLLQDRGWRPAGFLVLGLAVLVRPNFLAWIGFAGLLWAWQGFRGTHPRPLQGGEQEAVKTGGIPLQGGEQEVVKTGGIPLLGGVRGGFRPSMAAAAAALLLFLLPTLLWAVRNQRVCGHFPVLSTLRGQTFYGGNNSVVANTLDAWGYWIFPNSIPGERTMLELSQTMSEYEVDVYYYEKGWEWIRANTLALPRLAFGKLVRAYAPVPWHPTVKSIAVAGCRGLLYLLGLAGLILAWRRIPPDARAVLGGMAGANLLTVIVFWGCERFAFEIEPFLIPFALASLLALSRARLLADNALRLTNAH